MTKHNEAVYFALDDVGPMTAYEISRLLGRNRNSICHSLSMLRKDRRIYVRRWERQDGKGGRMAPVYALGDLPDAKQPNRRGPKETSRRHRERHATELSIKRYGTRSTKINNIWSGLLCQSTTSTSK